mgnify:CR=1 FL=1
MKIFETDLQFLRELAQDRELDQYQIAVWPTPHGDVLASSAAEVETTASVVFWKTVIAVQVGRDVRIIHTESTRHVGPVDEGRRFVMRRAVTA